MRRNAKNRLLQWTVVVTILIVVPLCVLIVSALVADAIRYQHSTQMLVGVWRGDANNVFELRADGTGRGFVDSPKNAVFFRWQESDGTFTTFYEPETKSIANKLEQMIRGIPKCASPAFDVVNVDTTTLHLVADGGAPVVLTRWSSDEFLLSSTVSEGSGLAKQKATAPMR